MKRAVIFNYDSKFVKEIIKTLRTYNQLRNSEVFSACIYRANEYPEESMAGPADIIIHSGGDGIPIKEDRLDIRKLYICYSHQWKARREGGEVARLGNFIKGIQSIDVLEDDAVLGKKGKMDIMQLHEFAVVKPPPAAKVLATSRVRDSDGNESEIIEALRYPDGSVSIQGHPEEGTAAHVVFNFLDNVGGK